MPYRVTRIAGRIAIPSSILRLTLRLLRGNIRSLRIEIYYRGLLLRVGLGNTISDLESSRNNTIRVKANLLLNLSYYDFRKASSKVTNNITRVRIVGTSKFFTLPD